MHLTIRVSLQYILNLSIFFTCTRTYFGRKNHLPRVLELNGPQASEAVRDAQYINHHHPYHQQETFTSPFREISSYDSHPWANRRTVHPSIAKPVVEPIA